MSHPRIGERAYVRPTCPSIPVQRGEGLYGSFLPPEGASVLFDEFLLRRLGEGVIEVVPPAPAAPAVPAEPVPAEPVLAEPAPAEPAPAPPEAPTAPSAPEPAPSAPEPAPSAPEPAPADKENV